MLKTTADLKLWVVNNPEHPHFLDITQELTTCLTAENDLCHHFSENNIFDTFVQLATPHRLQILRDYQARMNLTLDQLEEEAKAGRDAFYKGDLNAAEKEAAAHVFKMRPEVIAMVNKIDPDFDLEGNCPHDRECLEKIKVALANANKILFP